MAAPFNSELRAMVRDLAKQRESIDRRQLYFALVQSVVWTPVSISSVSGQLEPGDLHPLKREGLDGRASFAFFSHESAAETWRVEVSQGVPLRLERMNFVDLLPVLLGAGAGSAFINPAGKFTGEIYRHELETMLQGARRLAQRSASTAGAGISGEVVPSFWERIMGWLK